MTDTVDVPQNVPEETAGAAPPELFESPSRISKFFAILAFLCFVGGAALFLVRLPYLALEPGNTFETESFIEVDGTEAYTSPGEVSFVTVHQRRLTAVDLLISSLQDSDEIFHEDVILGGRTLDEQREENALLMLSSQNTAIAAALNHLGFETAEPAGAVVIDIVEGGVLEGVLARNDVITEANGEPIATVDELFELIASLDVDDELVVLAGRPGVTPDVVEIPLTDDTSGFIGISRDGTVVDEGAGATIADAVPGGPVEGLLVAGDRITRIDDEEIDSFETLVGVLQDRRSGEPVNIEVVRGTGDEEASLSFDVTLGSRALERAGLAFVDTQFRDAELPIDVGFTTEDIGGPSAGLAFTLTVLDVLTEGDLTGGANIVVTGAIDRAGNVRPIGGAHQKAFAAQEADADVFIVPDGNFEEASAAVPELRVESVANLDEALDLLTEFGGNVDDLPVNGQL